MFRKDHVQKNILRLMLTDTQMFFMYILLWRCFGRTGGRNKVGERYFVEWIVNEKGLVND